MPSGGESSYFGFEYQFSVTVLLALLEHSKPNSSFQRIKVETSFGQDAELDLGKHQELSISTEDAERSVQIQVKTKLRNSQWQSRDIRNLLLKRDESGGTETVFNRLLNLPKEKFLFVSDGILSPKLAELRSSDLINYERQFSISSIESLKRKILQNYSGDVDLSPLGTVLDRIYVYPELSYDEVKRRIKSLLVENYSVTVDRAENVFETLLRLVEKCALRVDGKSSIDSRDISNIAGEPNLRTLFVEEDSLYLESEDFKAAKYILEKEDVLFIVGEPAVGKTILSRKLSNEYVEKRYNLLLPSSNDAHLMILDVCQKPGGTIVLLEDPFGIDRYNSTSGETFANQLPGIIPAIKSLKGKVKLIVTTRANVLGEAIGFTKLTESIVSASTLTIIKPDKDFTTKVLEKHLEYFHAGPSAIALHREISEFDVSYEDLLHVRQFAYALTQIKTSISRDDVYKIFEDSRPSHYKKWIKGESDKSQLYLILLLLVLDVNQFAFEKDFKRIYGLISPLLFLSDTGLIDDYMITKEKLLLANRIKDLNNKVDFVHPSLKVAMGQFVEENRGLAKTLSNIKDRLIESDYPLDQSVSTYILANYFDYLSSNSKDLEWIGESKYLQVLDTFTKYGTDLLKHVDKNVNATAKNLMGRSYDVHECSIDSSGNLIITKDDVIEGIGIYSAADLAEIFIEYELGDFKDLENSLYQRSYESGDYAGLDPIQRYKFALWLAKNRPQLNSESIFALHENLSYDPISFVRVAVTKFAGEMFDREKYHHVLERLCYDNSPAVQISALEKGLLPNWKNQTKSVQIRWLQIVNHMLENPVVRLRTAKGLVDQSGSLYFYHEDHTDVQRLEWFKAVAPKLLDFRFKYDDFNRYLAAFDKHYGKLDLPLKTDLLTKLNGYVQRNNDQTSSVVYSIEKIAFEHNPSSKEQELLLNLVAELSSYAKADLLFGFAENYRKLPNERFVEVINRPFYVETESELLLERASVLLGLLASGVKDVNSLPLPVRNISGNFDDALQRYIYSQSDEFKIAFIFQAVGYKIFEGHWPHSVDFLLNPLVSDLIDYFLLQENKYRIFMADIILKDAYHYLEDDKAKWLEYLEKVLSIDDVDFQKQVCNSLFEYNAFHSIYEIEDWALVLERFLTHENDDVRNHAFSIFDSCFYSIFEDIYWRTPDNVYYEKFREKFVSSWFNNNFFDYLFDNSPSMKNWSDAVNFEKWLFDNWDSFSSQDRKKYLDELVSRAGIYEINTSISDFIEKMGGKLLPDEKQMLFEVSKDGVGTAPVNIRGHEEYFARRDAMRKFEPRFDWSIFLGKNDQSNFSDEDDD